MLEITCVLDYKKQDPIYIQLYDYIKKEIQSGRIPINSKLPSQRKLANHLQISRNTIDAAYQQLLAEGYIRSEPRKGLFVEEFQSRNIITKKSHNSVVHLDSLLLESHHNDMIQYDFKQDSIDLEHFPSKVWRKLSSQSFNKELDQLYLNGDSQGELELRKSIAEYLFQSRGVYCLPEQIVIGAGTQYLLTMLCSLIGRDVTYGVEEPGFHRARLVLKNEGVNCRSVPLDKKGVNITSLLESDVKVIYVTPSHQFPYGTIMPVSRRMELIQWAAENGGYIIEDDYDGEFRYQGKPIPALQGLDNYGNIIYLGSFSKSLFPSICISYLVLPPSLMAGYQEKFSHYKQTVARGHQHTLTLFMREGYWERHVNKIRNIYKRKHALLLETITHIMGNKVNIIGAESGFHILLEPKNNMTEDELVHSAKNYGVKVYPISTYYDEAPIHKKPLILLGFGEIPETDIKKGISKLNKAWFPAEK